MALKDASLREINCHRLAHNVNWSVRSFTGLRLDLIEPYGDPEQSSTMPLSLTILLLLAGCGEPEEPLPPALVDLPVLPEATTASAAPRGTSRAVSELRIALVGEVRGEIEPCGCPTLPYGGFVRRERLLKTLPGPLFHLDAGETLLEGFSASRVDRRRISPRRRIARRND